MFKIFILKIKLRYKPAKAKNEPIERLLFYLKTLEAKHMRDIPKAQLCLLDTRMPAINISVLLDQVYGLLQHSEKATVSSPVSGIPDGPVGLRHFLEMDTISEKSLNAKIERLRALLNQLVFQHRRMLYSDNSTDNHNSRYLLRYLASLSVGLMDLYGYYENEQLPRTEL